jgi:hypothetical protein
MRILTLVFALAMAITGAAQAQTNTITVGGGMESSPVDRSDSYKGNLVWQHSLGGAYSIGTTAETYQVQGGKGNNAVKTSLEADAWYTRQVWGPVGIKLGVGIGERVQTPHNFGYYALYATGNYTINEHWTLNPVQYRYRNGFDSIDRFESHQVGTGVTYNIDATQAVSAKVYRTYGGDWRTQADGGALFYSVKF